MGQPPESVCKPLRRTFTAVDCQVHAQVMRVFRRKVTPPEDDVLAAGDLRSVAALTLESITLTIHNHNHKAPSHRRTAS